MATSTYSYQSSFSSSSSSSSQRGLAMVLALASAIVLSPLYVDRRSYEHRYEGKLFSCSGFMLPVLLLGLIVAIKTTSSSCSSSMQRERKDSLDSSSVFRIGSSSWGLAGILVGLMFVLSWQSSVKHFFWR